MAAGWKVVPHSVAQRNEEYYGQPGQRLINDFLFTAPKIRFCNTRQEAMRFLKIRLFNITRN